MMTEGVGHNLELPIVVYFLSYLDLSKNSMIIVDVELIGKILK